MNATPDSTLADPQQIIADLQRQLAERRAARDEALAKRDEAQRRLAERTAERDELLEQQTATAEVLQVINSSPGDLAPVFDAILERAHALCGAPLGSLVLYDGERLRAVATRGYPSEYDAIAREGGPTQMFSHFAGLLRGERYVGVADAAALPSNPLRRALVEIAGVRTAFFVPLRKDGALLGYISFQRPEVLPFTEGQIGLLENFAAQAVIAMENARLLTETREALEQQTATADVLQVINSSPGDLAPVFDAMLEKATRLCEVNFSTLWRYDGSKFHPVARHGVPEPFWEYLQDHTPPIFSRIIGGEELIHIPDVKQTQLYQTEFGRDLQRLGLDTVRSLLVTPLRQHNVLLGVIVAYRQEVWPFSGKQIALVQNFAAQAVIAMENARLLDELRQRQQELRVTFDNMADGVAMFDEALRLAAWNRNFQKLLQLPNDLLAERPALDTYIRYITERGEFGEIDPETQIKRLRARIGDHYSFERTRPDSTVIEVRHNPMPGGGIMLIYSDITERKRSEAEIRTARDVAEAAFTHLKAAQSNLIQAQKMAALGQLTAGIAHEIKNPLNFVNNFAGLSIELLDELKESAAPGIATLDEDARADVDETIAMLTGNLGKIAEHGRRADNIVKSMLEHSRGVSGERREVDLNALADEALNLAYHGARAQDQSFNITLERHFLPGLAPIEVAPQEMTRVFLNLFSNGFYATNRRARDSGDGAFRPILAVATREAGEAIEIKVHDNGTGIPPEIRDR